MGDSRASAALVCLVVSVGILGDPPTCMAATLRVAIDGSGDYTIVHQALAAAASGDTVTIAPGTYRDFGSDAPQRQSTYLGWIYGKDLTVLGAGRDVVTLDRDPQQPFSDVTWIGFSIAGSGSVHIEGITFDGIHRGILVDDSSVTVENCAFTNCEDGIRTFSTTELRVVDTVFQDCGWLTSPGGGIDFDSTSTADIANSTFTGCRAGIIARGSGSVSGCTIRGGRNGVVLLGSPQVVRGSTIGGQEWFGLSTSAEDALFLDNRFEGGAGVNIDVRGMLRGRGNVLHGADTASIALHHWSHVEDFVENHILAGQGYSVSCDGGPTPVTFDFGGNYWGTTDAAAIAASILDANDDPDISLRVLFEPFQGGPVEGERTSFGALKGRYHIVE